MNFRFPDNPIFITALFFLFLPIALSGQSTKVKGRVVDAATGEGIPFASIFFQGTSVGVSADIDGYYLLETRDYSLTELSASILGYDEVVKTIVPRSFNDIDFGLKQTLNELHASVVKPDDRYVKSILRKIDEAKSKNDPERRPQYDCDIYAKNELDLSNPQNQIVAGLLPNDFMFVYNYMDTSLVSGQPYLPLMIAEASSHFYHTSNPEVKKEVLKASRVSGIDREKTIAQFTGNFYVKTNFYEDFINIFEVEIPSPLVGRGTGFYNYYLIDSLQVDGRKTYKIRFHPAKWVSTPVFDGEMDIDAEEYALRSAHAKLKSGMNVNWLKAIMLDVEHTRLPEEGWFYKQDKIYADLSVSLQDSSKMVSFIARRQIDYSNPSFTVNETLDALDKKASVLMDQNVLYSDEAYWKKVRPYPLTEKEQGIYNMVDSIKNVPLYKGAEKFFQTLATGFYDFRYVGIGPYSSFYSFNDLEGDRVQFGLRTNRDLSHKFRVMGYAAYGFGDKELKGGGTLELQFNNMPTRKLTFMAKRDAMQLGYGSYAFGSGNIMSSVLSKVGGRKLSIINDYSLSYQHEISQDLNIAMALESRRIFPNAFVPMYHKDSSMFGSIGYNQAKVQFRISKNEVVTRGVFDKHYMYSDHPVVTLDLTGSMKGVGKNEYDFLRPEFSVRYLWLMPPFGASKIQFNAGMIIGTVPYPMLKIHEGNGTYYFSKNSFACMNPYEFASDTWASVFWEHNFKGCIFGLVPGLRSLHLREVLSLRAAYGTVRDKNKGIVGDPDSGSGMLFPAGMKTLDRPYVELGAGITNIFRLIRIDAFWRMTHRYDVKNGEKVPHDNRFVLNFGFEFKF